ncbi:MAG: hypothetical protein O7F75_12255, partial [Alphaproteobacteria bacterium]|nr:hypothetical protein [Alphaproteobacteria bacterium]
MTPKTGYTENSSEIAIFPPAAQRGSAMAFAYTWSNRELASGRDSRLSHCLTVVKVRGTYVNLDGLPGATGNDKIMGDYGYGDRQGRVARVRILRFSGLVFSGVRPAAGR